MSIQIWVEADAFKQLTQCNGWQSDQPVLIENDDDQHAKLDIFPSSRLDNECLASSFVLDRSCEL
jgi:hypothetical protein